MGKMMKYGSFPQDKGVFCFFANIRNYLKYYSLNITEAWLSGILGYYGFYFTTKGLHKRDILNGRNGSISDLFTRLNACLEHPLKSQKYDISNDIPSTFIALLSEGRIPLVWINDYYLDHTNYYNTVDYWSIIPILEISKETVIYFDNDMKSTSLEVFCKAINRNGTYTIAYPETDSLHWQSSESIMMKAGLTISYKHLLEGSADGDECYGIKGMKRLAEEIKSRYTDKKELYHIFFLLNNPSGPTITREEIVKLFDELEKRLPELNVTECRELYSQLAEDWRMAANLIFKASSVSDRSILQRISTRIEDLSQREEKGAMLLKSLFVLENN